MELKQYVAVVWKWKWLVALAALVGGTSAYWVESRAPRFFRATSTIMVGQYLQSTKTQGGDIALAQQLAQSYTLVVKRQSLLQAAIARVGSQESASAVAARVNASVIPQSPMFQIAVVDVNPSRAVTLVNGIAEQLIQESPTPQQDQTDQERDFVGQQLTSLQARIADAETMQKDLDQRLAQETSARAIQDLQSQSAALQQKIAAWQSTYVSLLEQYRGARVNYLSVIEPSSFAVPVTPAFPINTAVAAMAGAMLAIMAAFLLDYIDDSVRSDDGSVQSLGLAVIGAIPRFKQPREPDQPLVILREPRSAVAEAYQGLRALVEYSWLPDASHRLLVASPVPEEGKSTVAANLAAAIAQGGKRVVICDGDLRRPTQHTLFGLPQTPGISELLQDSTLPIERALHRTSIASLRVLPSGANPSNPAALLGSDAMKGLLAQLDRLADVVIVDSPAGLAVSDTAILGAICGQAILVAAVGRTRRGQVQQARQSLEQVGTVIVGLVLNRVAPRRNRAYEYYVSSTDGTPSHSSRRQRAMRSISALLTRARPDHKASRPS